MKYVAVEFSKNGKQYTYACKNSYKKGELLVVGLPHDMSIVTVIEMVEKPSFECRDIIGTVETE